MRILLVEPNFPYPSKSKNRANEVHKNFVPIGLLKLGKYYKEQGHKVKLVRSLKMKSELGYFKPDKILITSIFTYWSEYVWGTVRYYRGLFPDSEIQIGGIYVTLHHEYPEFKRLARKYKVKCHVGLHDGAEKVFADYSLLYANVNHHLMHGMRGCIRRCNFCGVWRVEPRLIFKTPDEIKKEIAAVSKNKVIFLDNNFFANPHKKEILRELAELRVHGKPILFESQSGFDGRLLEKEPELADLLKAARFNNVRIAWDHGLEDASLIKRQVDLLVKAGYPAKDISIFMIYNFDIPYEQMVGKIKFCKKWGTQIIDCRYRPLESTKDGFKASMWRKGQTDADYYIHKDSGWTDEKIRDIRKKVRQHNIWIRYAKDRGLKYDKKMEKWSAIHNTFKFFGLGRPPQMEIIECNRQWPKRITQMNKVKNICIRFALTQPKLTGLTKSKIDAQLARVLKNQRLKSGSC